MGRAIMSDFGKSGGYYCTEPKALDGQRNLARRHRGSREACRAIVTGTARALVVPAPMVRRLERELDAAEGCLGALKSGNPKRPGTRLASSWLRQRCVRLRDWGAPASIKRKPRIYESFQRASRLRLCAGPAQMLPRR